MVITGHNGEKLKFVGIVVTTVCLKLDQERMDDL